MTVRVKITEKDRGWKELQRRVAAAKRGAFTLVGVQGAESAAAHVGAANGDTVGDIATVHEFGVTITLPNGKQIVIPERSFIRATIDQRHAKLQRTATLAGRGMLLGKFTERQALELIGEHAVGEMKQRIADGIPPPNAPRTIARKGSSTPLIDKGQLRGSLTHKPEGL